MTDLLSNHYCNAGCPAGINRRKVLDTQSIFKYINCVGLMKTYTFSMFLTIYQTPGPMQKVSP